MKWKSLRSAVIDLWGHAQRKSMTAPRSGFHPVSSKHDRQRWG
jgi:hypothetical protein